MEYRVLSSISYLLKLEFGLQLAHKTNYRRTRCTKPFTINIQVSYCKITANFSHQNFIVSDLPKILSPEFCITALLLEHKCYHNTPDSTSTNRSTDLVYTTYTGAVVTSATVNTSPLGLGGSNACNIRRHFLI